MYTLHHPVRLCGLIVWLLWGGGALYGQAGTLTIQLKPEAQVVFWSEMNGFSGPKPAAAPAAALFTLNAPVTVDSICKGLLRHFRERAYLAVSIDSLQQPATDGRWTATFHLGPAMRWIRLRPADERSAAWMNAAGYRGAPFDDTPLQYAALLALQQNVLEALENNGYPFATVSLDSLNIDEKGLARALLRVDEKRFFTFKGLKLNGDVKLPAYFLPHYLGLRSGSPYSRARILRLKQQLNALLFLETNANPTVTFAGNEALVNLFLQKKRASRFDFIIGILPQPEDAGQVLLTGSLSAAFQNALNLAERFSMELERLRPETQKLDVQGSIPYLFGTVFGADGRLNIFKRDSTWVDTQAEIGAQYILPEGNYFRFFWETRAASLQKIDTAAILASKRLPSNLDLRQNGFGLETSFERLDYRFNPRKGWRINLRGSAGFNRILRNSQIESLRDPIAPDFRFATLYDSLAARSSRFKVELRAEWFIPILTRSTLKLSLRGSGIFSSEPVFANEQYRVGGNKLLRGFNEESIQATRFAIATAEWRLLFGRNAFLSAFSDWGYIENIAFNNRVFLRPAGLGAGMNFETQAGIFGITVAAGRPDTGLGFDFRAVKFHLGYVSLF